MASPSHHRRRMEPADWSTLPHDILYSIFLKLGQSEIMQGPELVCTAWRRVAVDEPTLWRRVEMMDKCLVSAGNIAMARAAVDRGAGQCVAFSGPLDDDLLLHLVERAPFLKSICISELSASNKVLNMALKKLLFLEDFDARNIERSDFISSVNGDLFESVCQACPRLKKLKLSNVSLVGSTPTDGQSHHGESYEIPLMPKLRSIKLNYCYLTTKVLSIILDSCPLLKYLEIDGEINARIDDELWVKVASVKHPRMKLRYHH